MFLQLSLWVERWDETGRKDIENPNAEHVRVLWRMERDKRVRVWRRLGRFEEVTELELGGEHDGRECPMDMEELFMLLPEGELALAGVRGLLLGWCANNVDDGFLRALASAGCGENLTSLTLQCGCLCVLGLPLMLCVWEWSGSGSVGGVWL